MSCCDQIDMQIFMINVYIIVTVPKIQCVAIGVALPFLLPSNNPILPPDGYDSVMALFFLGLGGLR
jgi:hypothetical protein